MSRISYGHQTGIFDPKKFVDPVHVIGCGGIGSALVFALAKLGVREIHLWDTDVVEDHNIPCQLVYRPTDITDGITKPEAIAAFLERQEAECKVVVHNEFVGPDTELEGIVISGVDSMASRMAIWQAVQENAHLIPFYMDGRIGGESLQLLSLDPSDPDDVEMYEAWLFPDEEAAELPCAERTVIHPAVTLSGLMIAQITRFLRELPPVSNVMFDMKTMQYTQSR